MGRMCCVLVTSKPEGIWLLFGLCDGLFAHWEGNGDICGCGHSGKRKRGKGPMEKWTIELKYRSGLHNLSVPLLLLLSPGAYITHLTSMPHTRFIPLARIPLALSTLTIHTVISLRHVTNFPSTSFTHHFRLSLPSRRSIVRRYGTQSAAAELVSSLIDSLIIASVIPSSDTNLPVYCVQSSYEEYGYCEHDTY